MADDPGLEELLAYLRDHRGFDFTSYKRNTLSRRIDKRMYEMDVATYSAYIDFLEVHPDEFPQLFNTILINVTSFFRDGEAWDQLRESVLPGIVRARSEHEPIRVWSAGCASGEEAYTLAMVLAEEVGMAAFKDRVKIYATDVDDDALAAARNGSYPLTAVAEIDDAMVERYFEHVGGGEIQFRNDLRRNLIFGRHDITRDAPISQLDLLVCRNTLMYFNAEAQGRVLPRFHYALKPDGALFLGRAEMLLTHSDLFVPRDTSHRLFERVSGDARILPDLGIARSKESDSGVHEGALRDLAFDAGHVAEIVLDLDTKLIAANALARAGFSVGSDDIGKPVRDLEVSYRPIELRSRIEQAFGESRTIHVRNVERTFPQGDPQYLDIVLSPLTTASGSPAAMSIKFVDVTRFVMLRMDLKRSNEELETAYEELQSTNEELETTNEELQSTVEELETTNEELQSTNEELETMNEELQSTNEELEIMNIELRTRTDELGRGNRFHDALLASLTDSVIALNGRTEVVLWSRSAEDAWGLQADEAVDRPLAELDFGLPMDGVIPAVDAVAAGEVPESSVEVPAHNRRGRAMTATVVVRPIYADRPSDGTVLITTMRET